MQAFESVDGVLDFAISREEEAYEFYTDLASSLNRADLKTLFQQFAEEERGHRRKLEAVKQGKKLAPAEKQVLDLKMSDYLVAGKPGKEMSYQEVLILAMKKEKASFKLYTDLADRVPGEDLKNTFLLLAQEEARHKLRFEVEYDNEIMGEN